MAQESGTGEEAPEQIFAVFAEATGYQRPLVMTDMSFGRLIDEIIFPYETDQPFFIDGAPLKKTNLSRLKVLRQSPSLAGRLADLYNGLTRGPIEKQRLYGEQYHVRLEALLRESAEDVTAQVLKAFDRTVKPSLKDYLPKREVLIAAAFQFFLESMRNLCQR